MSERAGAPPRISVVIPTWRDASSLARLLPTLAALETIEEVIVVDASADEQSERSAREYGSTYLPGSLPNRGAQMNAGAAEATGDVIIFQHADTELTGSHVAAIAHALLDPEIIGGAFYRKFDGRHPRLQFLEHVARFLTRTGKIFYGDQSIFVRREVFTQLGGFAEIPLMEDMEFSRRLRGGGRTVVLDPPIKSSARRHLRKGAWKTSVQNGLFIVLYKCGVSPFTLHRWYYGSAAQKSGGASAVIPSAAERSRGIP